MNRVHGIDFCRAVLMLLGLFFHTGLIYGLEQNWRVTSTEQSWIISLATDFIHKFRMEGFYLISGFLYLLVFNKKRNDFVKTRIYRALLPLIFCGLLINTVMNYYSYNKSYDWDSINYFLKGQWLGHLWFLGNLIVYFLLSLPFSKKIMEMQEIKRSSMLLMFYIIAPLISIVGLSVAKTIFEGTIVFVSIGKLFYYYSYFLLGCLCYRNKEIFLSILNLKYALLSIGIFISLTSVSHLYFLHGEMGDKIIDKLSGGPLTLAIISIIHMVGSRKSKTVTKLSESSYTIYLLHQPLIILLYVFIFKKIELNIFLEYSIIIFCVFFISYAFHFYAVKKSSIMLFLFNGVLYSKEKKHKE